MAISWSCLPLFTKPLVAALLSLSSLAAFSADYYVVVPVPSRTVSPSVAGTLNAYAPLPGGYVGAPYAGFDFKSLLQVSGDANFSASYARWAVSAGQLPAGLSLDPLTGQLSGTPTAAGSSSFEVTATYKTKTGATAYQVTVAALTVSLASATLPGAKVNTALTYDFKPLLSVSGDPAYSASNAAFSATGVPGGLSLSSDGVLSGVPTSVGSSTITVSANYRGIVAQKGYTLGVTNQRTCLDVKDANPSATDGLYTVYPDGTSAVQVYCDMTKDGGGWTLIVKALAGTNSHANTAAVGTLTSPTQTTAAKFSDALINAMPKTAYRMTNNSRTYSIFFDTSDSFASTRQVANKASLSISSPVWEGPFYDPNHRGLNTYKYLAGNFGRGVANGATYTGAPAETAVVWELVWPAV